MAKIKKVVIEAGGKEFSLSVEEAKALRDILNATFQEEKTTYVPYPYPIYERRYYGPWITWCNTTGETVYCSTNGNALTTGSSTTL
jgi:hypothetical protein